MLYDDSIEWVHYLTRPFSLFGSSLWHRWYDSNEITDVLGIRNPDALLIEQDRHVIRYYQEKNQLASLQNAKDVMIQQNTAKLGTIYERGFVLNAQAEEYLQQGPSSFKDLDSAIHFIIDLTLHATIIPAIVLGFSERTTTALSKKLIDDAEKLRAISYYPRFLQHIIMPHVRSILEQEGITDTGSEELVTLLELSAKDFSSLPERIQARKDNKLFVYQILHGKESIQWVPDTAALVYTLEGMQEKDVMATKEIKGTIAYKGNVRGIARLILRNDDHNHLFNEGDILVSVNSNPTLMPLIVKAGAIVTDEGGMATHASIISRELKKPCIVGTKIATHVIKEGDLVEVDATIGTIRILKKV